LEQETVELEVVYEERSFLLVEFEGPTLKDFLEFSNNAGHKTIYLTSLGGHGAVMVAMADIINKAPEEYTIKILEMNCSSSFLLCLYALCDIVELGNHYNLATSHMWHSCQFDSKNWTKEEIKSISLMDTKTFNLIKTVLTFKQIKKRERFVRWAGRFLWLRKFIDDDIYLTNDQMRQLLGERFKVI